MGKEISKKTDIRIDKWLWAMRLFKTRGLSAEACRKGRVTIDDLPVKPSRTIKGGDIIKIRRSPVLFTFRVKEIIDKRQPAKMVNLYLEDITPAEEKEKVQHKNLVVFSKRDRGTGRPTKKERRIIDKFGNFD